MINEAYAGAEAGGGALAAAGGAPTHEFIIVVCHMNVIRYRWRAAAAAARDVAADARRQLRHRDHRQPKGQASLGRFADTGHLSIEQTTFH